MYSKVRIQPPTGGYLATLADGFHSSSATHGPTLEDSRLWGMGDDFVNVHARPTFICRMNQSEFLTATLLDQGAIEALAAPGELLSVFSAAS